MPNILKHFIRGAPDLYVFPEVEELREELPSVELPDKAEQAEEEPPPEESPPPPEEEEEPEEDPISFAKVQADAILRAAEEEAEAYKAKAREDMEEALAQQRQVAREEGYSRGFAEGMAEATREAKTQQEEMAAKQLKEVQAFLEEAVRIRDRLLDDSREELKELAMAIAEKVIRVSLRGSSDIIMRMVESATDTHKRCEWARVYIAGCDARGRANTIPELTAALGRIADRVKVIPMEDDESGTCIIEMPDVILDASVSTQLEEIRGLLADSAGDEDRL